MARAMSAKDNLTGLVFGRLTVKGCAGSVKGHRTWLCSCSCGVDKVLLGSNLKSGHHKSCGCFRREVVTVRNTSHGETGCPEHISWSQMWDRTTNKANPAYERYKDKVPSPEFRSYEFFLEHLGRRPSQQHSLDRIDNNLGYLIGNLKWSTSIEQNQNRKNNICYVEISTGKLYIQSEVSRRLGSSYDKVGTRLHNGWTVSRATNNLYRLATSEEILNRAKNSV